MEYTYRKLFLPLENLDNCSYCANVVAKTSEPSELTEKARICKACGERAYCLSECQMRDWKSHKPVCGTTNRIQIRSFYPLLAYLIRLGHHQVPPHPALTHRILSSPNPGNFDEIVDFSDGRSAVLILLGDSIPYSSSGTSDWWPTAMEPSDSVRRKLCDRIHTSGNLLPILLATCISLASEMYSTTAVPATEEPLLQYTQHRRVRLTYGSAPIADFGIAKGSTHVSPQYLMAYYNVHDETLIWSQDPDDHYWIYFTTVTGEDMWLDCSLLAFGSDEIVDTDEYAVTFPNVGHQMPPQGFVPALFFDREYKQHAPLFLPDLKRVERQRFSILRDPEFREALSYHDPGLQWPQLETLYTLMDKIGGRRCTDSEREVLRRCLPFSSMFIRLHLHHQTFLKFPARPLREIYFDPGEEDFLNTPAEIQRTAKHMNKFNKLYRKGEISEAQLKSEFDKASHKYLG